MKKNEMDALHQLEILWILLVQSLGDWLQEPMRLASLLGQEEFYMLVMPILYWSLDTTLGLRVAIMLLLSNGVGTVMKLAFHSPRPYWIDTNVQAMSIETSFGVPSGHAQNAAGIWGLIATSLRHPLGKALLVVLIFLIGFSRIYLGMHFISDVILGWLIGGILLWLFLKAERPVTTWLRTRTLSQLLATALGSSVVLGLVILLSAATLGSWQIPEVWIQNAAITQPVEAIDPLNIESAFTLAGTWLGLMAGAAWFYYSRGGFDAGGAPLQRLLRYAIGIAGVFIFWFVLGQLLPDEKDTLSFALRYVRYTLVGIWISAAAPLLFERLGLCVTKQKKMPPLSPGENPL